MTHVAITALGVALPDQALGNSELALRLGLSEDWIVERSGIHQRRVAAEDETVASLGSTAARRALETIRLDGRDIDLVICATITAQPRFPAAACLIADAVGSDAPAFDLNAACSGFLFALAQAQAAIVANCARRVLVVGADVMSRVVDPTDVKTRILFGDAAGAAIVESSSSGGSIGPFVLHSDGSHPEILSADDRGMVIMDGREVYRAAVTGMTNSVREVLERSGITAEDLDLVVAHQANQRILDAVAHRLGLADRFVFSNISRVGNTSAASIPLALHDALSQGLIRPDDRIVLTAFGAGLCWGAGLVHWSGSEVGRSTSTNAEYAIA